MAELGRHARDAYMNALCGACARTDSSLTVMMMMMDPSPAPIGKYMMPPYFPGNLFT